MPTPQGHDVSFLSMSLALIAALLSVAAAQSQVCPRVAFGPPIDYAAEDSPVFVTAADLNRDGVQDLIVATAGGNELLVFLGRGAGVFGPPSRYNVGTGPNSVVVADFNGDGNPDIASADWGSSTVTVLLGNGDGSFGPPAIFSLPPGSGPSSIVAGDFNGDGIPDLAVADSDSSSVSILLGDGLGGFLLAANYAVGANPGAIVTGDFNYDSVLDIATADTGAGDVTVLLGNGDGTFGQLSSYPVGSGPSAIAVADLNGDGKVDLVTADRYSHTVTVLLGLGGGTALFGTGVTYACGADPTSVAVYDFNADGKPDLAIVCPNFNSFAVMAGRGDGTFQAATYFAKPYLPSSLVAIDLDGDGKADLACVGTTPPALSIYLNTSQPLPDATITVPPGVCANSTGNVASVPDGCTGASYAWSVTNGTITAGGGTQQITFTAGASGTVGLSVTVTDATGCSSYGSQNVVIHPIPSATITTPATICPNSTSRLTSVPVPGFGASYAWTITNGTIVSGIGTNTITYRSGPSGVVDLGCTVQTADGCSASGTTQVSISSPPSATITGPAVVCAGSTGNLVSVPNAGLGATYTWQISSGTISGTGSGSQAQFGVNYFGPVSISVTVRNSAGCSSYGSLSVQVAGGADITAPSEVCPNATGLTAAVQDSGVGATYTWTVTNGAITAGAGTRQITFTSGATGQTVLNVSVLSAGGCKGKATQYVTIKPGPSTVITAASPVCPRSTGNLASVPDAGSGATYTWTITNGMITGGSGTSQVTFSVGDVGQTVLTVTVQDPSGCIRVGNTSVNVTAPSASIFGLTATCANSGNNFAWVADAGNGATYAWSITNGTITAGAGTNQITFSVGTSGVVSLTVTVRSALGCSTTGLQDIQVAPIPPANITAPVAVCAGSTGNVASVPDAGAGAVYTWSITNGNVTGGFGTRAITFAAGATGPVSLAVIVSTPVPCNGYGYRDVPVNPLPSAVITAPVAVCPGSSGNVASVADAGAGASYAWTIANGSITAGSGTRVVTFTAGTSGQVGLAVTVQSAAGCAASGSQSVAITPPPSAVITAPAGVCAGSSGSTASVPDAGSGATYTWGIVNGSITGGTGTNTITFTAGPGGVVGLGVLVQSAIGCRSAGLQIVMIEPLPSATITAPSSVRHNSTGNVASVPDAGQGATYAWVITNGTITSGAGTKRVVFQAGTRGTLTLSVTVTRATGCEAAGSRNVSVN